MAEQFTISFEGSVNFFSCPKDARVLIAMEKQGLSHIPVGCRGGGCGTCRVIVTQGRYRTRKMSRVHISEDQKRAGYVLACRLIPESDLLLRLAGDGPGV
jgi:ferredoxin